MKLALSRVEFSKYDEKIKIKVPRTLTPKLAYFIGIHVGDGTLVYDKSKYHYIIGYTGHLIDEWDFHRDIITPLVRELFNKDVIQTEDLRENKKSVRIFFKSKAIFTFLSKVIELPVGSKKTLGIPSIIKMANNTIKMNFIRGLADTDFTLTFKKKYRSVHYYPSIAISSASKSLINDLKNVLIDLSFRPYYLKSYKKFDRRNSTYYHGAEIDLNGLYNLNLWMKKIGFTSTKHLTKYEIWKKYGYCPPNTNIKQRTAILNGKLSIGSFYK